MMIEIAGVHEQVDPSTISEHTLQSPWIPGAMFLYEGRPRVQRGQLATF